MLWRLRGSTPSARPVDTHFACPGSGRRFDRGFAERGALAAVAAALITLGAFGCDRTLEQRSLGTGVLLSDPVEGLLRVRNTETGIEVSAHDGQRFAPKGPAGPLPRADFGVTFDEGRRRVVVFGGQDPDAAICFDDTWVFDLDGEAWRQLDGATPGPRAESRLWFDRRSSEVFLSGGQAVRCGGRVHHDGFVLEETGWRPVFDEVAQ